MPDADPIELVFVGLGKLGPSSKATTLDAIRALPISQFNTIVDAGCGAGAQTLILADELHQVVHAVDNNEMFLRDLINRANAANLGQFISTHCLDLSEIADRFPNIDLLWSEGAAYNIGFATALESWSASINPSGSWSYRTAPVSSGAPSPMATRSNVERSSDSCLNVRMLWPALICRIGACKRWTRLLFESLVAAHVIAAFPSRSTTERLQSDKPPSAS